VVPSRREIAIISTGSHLHLNQSNLSSPRVGLGKVMQRSAGITAARSAIIAFLLLASSSPS